jgi:cyclopropane fatty-acyl-phospholipid synthase-like methyltransferase
LAAAGEACAMVALASAPKLAPFNPSSADVIDKACELVAPGLGPRDVVFDLGCGDGRLLVRMAQCFRCRCVGVEYDEVFVERARAEVKRQGLEALVEIRHG